MMQASRNYSRLLGGMLGVWIATSASAACAQVRINEIMAAPSTDWNGDGAYSSRDDEWLEIYNTSSTLMVLDSLIVKDGTHNVRYKFSGTLAGHAVRVVYGSQAYTWEKDHGQPADGFSFNNTGDTVELLQVNGSDTTAVDVRVYGKNEGGSERSTGRLPDGGDTYVIFDALNVYTGTSEPLGTGCMPSPGAENSSLCGTPVEPSTWGSIKALYRDGAIR